MSNIGRGTPPSESGATGELTADEEAVVQAIAAGSYFVFNETPSGSVDGSNSTFTLAGTPNPSSSLIITLQGQIQIQDSDYTLSDDTITFSDAPAFGMQLKAPIYTVSPV